MFVPTYLSFDPCVAERPKELPRETHEGDAYAWYAGLSAMPRGILLERFGGLSPFTV